MKLFSTTAGQRNKKKMLLVGGDLQEVVDLINSVGDGCEIGQGKASDLEENGGNWGCPPDDWSEEAPYYFGTSTKTEGGFESLQEALDAYVSADDDVILER